MAEAADALDGDQIAGVAPNAKGVKNGNASAKQRSGFGGGQVVGMAATPSAGDTMYS